MTKLPKTIKIGGFTWTVEQDAKVAFEGNVYGSTHHGTQTIFLDPTLTEQKKWQTLFHETIHAVYWQCGLSKDKAIPNDSEEKIIHVLSMGMYQVLKDNDIIH